MQNLATAPLTQSVVGSAILESTPALLCVERVLGFPLYYDTAIFVPFTNTLHYSVSMKFTFASSSSNDLEFHAFLTPFLHVDRARHAIAENGLECSELVGISRIMWEWGKLACQITLWTQFWHTWKKSKILFEDLIWIRCDNLRNIFFFIVVYTVCRVTSCYEFFGYLYTL